MNTSIRLTQACSIDGSLTPTQGERERERERESWIEILAAIANEGDQVLLDYK
jgi:hypothetical protein